MAVNATIRIRCISKKSLEAVMSILEEEAKAAKVIEIFDTTEPLKVKG